VRDASLAQHWNVLVERFNLTNPRNIEKRFGFVDWHEKLPGGSCYPGRRPCCIMGFSAAVLTYADDGCAISPTPPELTVSLWLSRKQVGESRGH
jgi:hypothetical protein